MAVKKLHIIYIVPSRYDDEGYVYQWRRGVVPSNTLAVLKGLTQEMMSQSPFPGVETVLSAFDESVERIPFKKIVKIHRQNGTRVAVGLIGVQTGQFSRASDIALKLRKHGINVMIGGFHVSGVLALFDEMRPELQRLLDAGVTLIQGESETPGVMKNLFQDVIDGKLQPIYRFPAAPSLEGAATPVVEKAYLDHFTVSWGTIDTSRGCPYGCTFCTVINVQGRKMRCRKAESVLAMIRENHKNGITAFFFTDDNFARSKIWREVFDGLIEMRKEGKKTAFMMQVDTQAYKIEDFVEKAKAAGCRMAFIGMESVNPESLAAAGKLQNSVGEYRKMVEVWEKAGILVHVGYIIGFPADSRESVHRDVIFLRDEVGVHEASFFMLTPLPGSVDHREMLRRGEPIDPDFNKYDSFHETFHHAKMKPGEWKQTTLEAYAEFYSKDAVTDILRRTPPEHYWYMFWNCIWYRYSGVFSKTHPMMTGFFRIKHRDLRRPEMPKEGFFRFLRRRIKERVHETVTYAKIFFEFRAIWLQTRPPKQKTSLQKGLLAYRKLLLWRAKAADKLRHGQIFSWTLLQTPYAVLVDLLLLLRFSLATIRQERYTTGNI
ncbi:MAG: radical SAM protein [Planctomycetaceae bacterium]|jgi:radical SAM superfamily enzyme YgiQ (UPF0313 family)|nr:radical SAM protein [Planctomycetaceae bacterium]